MMDESAPNYWFTSTLFQAEPGEDSQTNPRRFGRQPANWLKSKFEELGYEVEEVIPEDWGWCVMCQRDPYLLWVGCTNLADCEQSEEGAPPPPQDRLLWNVFLAAEIPFFRYLLRRRPNTGEGLERLNKQLEQILISEPNIHLVDEVTANSWYDA